MAAIAGASPNPAIRIATPAVISAPSIARFRENGIAKRRIISSPVSPGARIFWRASIVVWLEGTDHDQATRLSDCRRRRIGDWAGGRAGAGGGGEAGLGRGRWGWPFGGSLWGLVGGVEGGGHSRAPVFLNFGCWDVLLLVGL